MHQQPTSCYFCGKDVEWGTGLILLNHLMCAFCERLLLTMPIGDNEYLAFKEKIKKLWFM